MFTDTDYDKLQQLMAKSPENEALIKKLLASHKETISTISHEIRNPLTLVYSTLQLIESQHPEVTEYKHWLSMREDIEYMKLLLEELSVFNNGANLSLEKFDFLEFMQKLVLSFAITFSDSPVEFTSCISPALPHYIGDRLKLKEAFLNLLRNAAEAVDNQGRVSLDAQYRDSCIIVTITDTGCGIDDSVLKDIFLPFVTHKQGGTGLGLPIVKRTVEAHKGTIHIQSSADVGTAFTITLPVQQDCQQKS